MKKLGLIALLGLAGCQDYGALSVAVGDIIVDMTIDEMCDAAQDGIKGNTRLSQAGQKVVMGLCATNAPRDAIKAAYRKALGLG